MRRFSYGTPPFRVLDLLCLLNRQIKTFHESPLTLFLELYPAHTFDTRGHHSSSNSFIESSSGCSTLKRWIRLWLRVKATEVGMFIILEANGVVIDYLR